MKTIFKIMAMFMLLFSVASCSNEDEVVEKDPILDMNYANIAGTWRLAEWNGAKLDDNRYFYITFNRKAENNKYTYAIYQNFDSAPSRHITGSFSLENDEDLGNVVNGVYDFWMGEWNHSYVITDFRSATMKWTAKDDPEDVSVYVRCIGVPEDILNGQRMIEKAAL